MHTASKQLPPFYRRYIQATNEYTTHYAANVSRTTRPIEPGAPKLTQSEPFLHGRNIPIVQDYYHPHGSSNTSSEILYIDSGDEYYSTDYEAEDSDIEYEEDSEFGDNTQAISADESSDSDDHDFIVYTDDCDDVESTFNSDDDTSESASGTSSDSQYCSDESDVSIGDEDSRSIESAEDPVRLDLV